MRDFKKLSQLTEDLQKNHPRAVRPPNADKGLFPEWVDALDALRREYDPPPVSTQRTESRPEAQPAERAQHADTETVVRSRKRRVQVSPQQFRARKVLKALYPLAYPTREEVSDDGLWEAFRKKYDDMITTGALKLGRRPSRSSVLREAGRK